MSFGILCLLEVGDVNVGVTSQDAQWMYFRLMGISVPE